VKLSKRKRRGGLLMNMTPMIDVTFLLLIFFMTVNQVSAVNNEALELPKLAGSDDQQESSVTINIDRFGDVRVSGERRSLAEVVTLVSQELAKVGGDPLRLSVSLRIDRRGNCQTVNEVVDALTRLGVHRVAIAVEASR
jgi:biopolymer transport protein ExbD